MLKNRDNNLGAQIIEKAKGFGACLAGIANVEVLKESPSHLIYGKLDEYKGVGTKKSYKIRPGEVEWPENAKSAIIIAVEHPEKKPEIDWWEAGYSGSTAGNRILMSINDGLSEWLEKKKESKQINCHITLSTAGFFSRIPLLWQGWDA